MDGSKIKFAVFGVATLVATGYFVVGGEVEKTEEPSTAASALVKTTPGNPFIELSPSAGARETKTRTPLRSQPDLRKQTKLRTFEEEMLKRSPNESDRARRLAAKNEYFNKLREQLKDIRQDSPPPTSVTKSVNTATEVYEAPTSEPNELAVEPLPPVDENLDYLNGLPDDVLLDELPPEEYYGDY